MMSDVMNRFKKDALLTEFKIRKLISGGLITNYFCSSRCRHCLYNCSPAWEKAYMTPQAAEETLLLIRRLGCSAGWRGRRRVEGSIPDLTLFYGSTGGSV